MNAPEVLGNYHQKGMVYVRETRMHAQQLGEGEAWYRGLLARRAERDV